MAETREIMCTERCLSTKTLSLNALNLIPKLERRVKLTKEK